MNLKEYMAPEMEVIALKMQGMLAASIKTGDDDDDDNPGGGTYNEGGGWG